MNTTGVTLADWVSLALSLAGLVAVIWVNVALYRYNHPRRRR